MQMSSDGHQPHLTAKLNSSEVRAHVAAADIIIASDPAQGMRTVLYGREMLEAIAQTRGNSAAVLITFSLDFATDELDSLEAIIREVKGHSSFNPAELFPKFEIDVVSFQHDSDLLVPVQRALEEIRTNHRTLLPSVQLRFYYSVQAAGFSTANEELRAGAQMAGTPAAYVYSLVTLGHLLYQRLPQGLIKATRCLDLVHGSGSLERDIAVRCRSLHFRPTPRGPAYYSQRMPRMRFGSDPQERLVAFSQHALERICERTVYNWKDFGGHGDAFAFLDNCIFFEDCTAARAEPSFIIYNSCIPHFSTWDYVENVLGSAEMITGDAYGDIAEAATRPFYYRVGYCPVTFHGDIALATTLLFPGMNRQKGTPEGRLIDSSGLPLAEISRMKDQVETQLSMKSLVDNGDFSLIKWFHDNGVPQVVRIDSEVFKYD